MLKKLSPVVMSSSIIHQHPQHHSQKLVSHLNKLFNHNASMILNVGGSCNFHHHLAKVLSLETTTPDKTATTHGSNTPKGSNNNTHSPQQTNKFIARRRDRNQEAMNDERKAKLETLMADTKLKAKLGKRITLYLMRCAQKNIPITTVYFWLDMLLNHLQIPLEPSHFVQLLSLCKDEEQLITVFLISTAAEKVKLEDGTETIEPLIKLPKNIPYQKEQYERFRKLFPLDKHFGEVVVSTSLFHNLARLRSKFTYFLFRELQQFDNPLFKEYKTVECYNCVLSQYSKPPFTDMELVHKLLTEMKQNEATKPNIRTHTLLLDLIIKSNFPQHEKIQRILQMTKEMDSADTAFFNKLLTNLIDTNQFRTAIQLFTAIHDSASSGVDSKIRPDRITYHKMISLYFRIGQPEQALSIAKMFEQDPFCQITSYTCSLVIQGFIDADRVKDAVLLYENFIKHPKIKLDQIFFNAIISAAGKKNLPQLVQRAVRDMKELKVEPDLTLYYTTLSAYARMGLMPEAEKMYQLFKLKGFLTSGKHYTALMRGYFKLDNSDMVWDVFNRFLEDQKTREKTGDPLILDFAILSYLLAATKTRDQLESIYVHYNQLIEKKKLTDDFIYSGESLPVDEEPEFDTTSNVQEEDDEKIGAFTTRDLEDLYSEDIKFEESGKIAFTADVRPELFYYRLCRVCLYQRHTTILIQLLNHIQLISKMDPHSIRYFSKIILRYLATTGKKRIVYFFEVLEKLLHEQKKGTKVLFLDILANKYMLSLERLAGNITQQRIENYVKYRSEDLQDPHYSHIPDVAEILREISYMSTSVYK
ncbi:hypothetical protein C9374_000960 [Naegleria lovaniensis]|uniref:Uncharacterized protein n=1 Tax=Naegleria lovaniensis TaxID=51637 RepID=A0AA88GW77_NAELO|nr:uncharacterized protein C9374_000960 [Naegleria lovaniensis]KAG2388110.1 hypothetical protein C9374_000960 [Naegleria lovaniensis]